MNDDPAINRIIATGIAIICGLIFIIISIARK